MELKNFLGMRSVALLTVCTFVALCAAASTKKFSRGFPFPPHLIGTNYSAMNDLQAYKEKYDPVDLGIDLLDDHAPEYIRRALGEASLSDPAYNQYTPNDGTVRLRTAIADLYSPLVGQPLNPAENVLVTIGATEAMHSAIVGHTFADDEWILIEPAYSMYLPMIRMAGGVPRFTALKLNATGAPASGDDWKLDQEELQSLFNERTKGIILNNPVNPVGKVYTAEELEFIAELARERDVLVISDEAHEWITHKPHRRIASLPGMYERTITVGSASKSFSLAGWRIGWAYGHRDVLNHVKTVHMNSVDCAPAPQQEALAFAFEEEIRHFGSAHSYFATHREHVRRLRDMLVEAFADVGLKPVVASGGFCMLVDWTPIKSRVPRLAGSMDFAMWFIKHIGVLGLPATSYFGEEHKSIGQDYARFCYHKKVDTLEEAARKLSKLKGLL
ncbi:kynurenine aminotransferase-like [Phymastichus coffea]|uniref:kynurenine aminotransferase-like n=1 Tax=Phymastichus coffea TaxID=108790 RepID=UPI00273B1BE2|nr:kynurenine aminotransferase-like [Phymastichus coffea]